MFIGRNVSRPKTYSLPEILVSGTLTVQLNGGAWNYKNNQSDYSTSWTVESGTDNYPVDATTMSTIAECSTYDPNAEMGIAPIFSGTYYGNASVTIQALDETTGTWKDEWTGSVTVYYGDNDNAINNGTWSKDYGGITTRIRPVIKAITATGCREDCINVYMTRIEPA